MHILLVLESFFPTHRAGTEIYVLNLCRYLQSKGYKVEVLISSTTGASDYKYEGIQVYTFKVPPKPIAKELNGIIAPRGIEHFIERVKAINPDLVHFHSFGRAINGYHLQAVKELGIKTAFTPHLGGFFCIKGDLLLNGKVNCDGEVRKTRCLSCLLQSRGKSKILSYGFANVMQFVANLKKAKKIIPPSFFQAHHRHNELQRVKQHSDLIFSIAPWIQTAFELNNIKKAIRIPQGISPIFLSNAQLSTHNSILTTRNSKPIRFAFIGRMHPSKGFHLLKQAWDNIETGNIKLDVVTSPSGDENQYFEQHKQWAKAKPNIEWHEGHTQNDVASLLRTIDVLILPSTTNEVAPLVILEAAAFGIPTIGSDYIAIKDMVEHGKNGLLFKNGDWHHLKHQLETIINQPELIAKFKQNIRPPMSMSVVAELIEKEYFKVLKDKW